jgi:hypothetical protein
MDTVEGLLIDLETLFSELRNASNAQQKKAIRREIDKVIRQSEAFIRDFQNKIVDVRVQVEILCRSVRPMESKSPTTRRKR